mmetsp:Transcript_4640/g.14853  ORF Transcript_4640/g.14853 Transcript_4640/m.14853 type:complete len:315 (-) Transcript_4640:1682-2626(-)
MHKLLATVILASRVAHRPPLRAVLARAPPRAARLYAAAGSAIEGLDTEINLDGMRKESQRKLYRAQKKAAKARERAELCDARMEELLSDEDAALEALEALPNCDELRAAAAAEAERVERLDSLVQGLKTCTASADAADATPLAQLLSLAADLGVSDQPPARPPPRPKKPKGPRAKPRLPYRVFRSEGGAEIRVGKQASDNDALSTDPLHRDADDWWMHAAGCAGSHVVIRAESVGDAATLPREVELDAAVLAANYSKAARSGSVGVNLCRARQVSKPAGAKPGLVQLSGDVRTLRLNWRNEKRRLERLRDALEG